MSNIMNVRDEIRLKVLSALLGKHAVVAHISAVQTQTGFHKATIKSSLDFLSREGVVAGFGPKINFRQFGFKLEVVSILQVDLSEESLFAAFLAQCNQNPHIYSVSSIIGSGNWNLMMRHYYRDVESFHQDMEQSFFRKIPGLFRLIKDRQVFYATAPHYKDSSRTNAVIELVRREQGFE